MTTHDPLHPTTPRLPGEDDDTKEPPGTHTPEHPIEDPPPEEAPLASGQVASLARSSSTPRATPDSSEDPPVPFQADIPRPPSAAPSAVLPEGPRPAD